MTKSPCRTDDATTYPAIGSRWSTYGTRHEDTSQEFAMTYFIVFDWYSIGAPVEYYGRLHLDCNARGDRKMPTLSLQRFRMRIKNPLNSPVFCPSSKMRFVQDSVTQGTERSIFRFDLPRKPNRLYCLFEHIHLGST